MSLSHISDEGLLQLAERDLPGLLRGLDRKEVENLLNAARKESCKAEAEPEPKVKKEMPADQLKVKEETSAEEMQEEAPAGTVKAELDEMDQTDEVGNLNADGEPMEDVEEEALHEALQDSLRDLDSKSSRSPKRPLSAVSDGESEAKPSEDSRASGRAVLIWRDEKGKATAPPSGLSMDALLNGLGGRRGRKASISAGDLLLVASGAHARYTLDPQVLASLKELLKPLSLDLKPQWALRPHQEDGYRWLMSRASSRLGAVLADAMGLGKTRQAISFMLGVRAGLTQAQPGASSSSAPVRTAPDLTAPLGGAGVKWERALVLAPAMLVRGDDSVWQRELREASMQWREPLRVWQWHGERACELRSEVHSGQWKGPVLELYDVVVTSYESFLQNQEQFIKESWTCIVLDEAQSIKNHATQTAAAVKRLRAPFRLALTGSPIENSLDDIHSILQFVEPDCAGTLADFRHRFPDSEEGRACLRRLLHMVTLRRESGEAIQMVAKEEVEVPVKMGTDQAEIYKALREGASSAEISPHKRLRELELLCTHPWCYVQRTTAEETAGETRAGSAKLPVPARFHKEAHEQDIKDSGKLTELFSILRGVVARREKALVFFCRTATSQLLAALVEREFGIRPGILQGATPMGEREKIIRDFRADFIPGESQSQVLLLSVWVGAVGLNLPEARWVVHVERVWNPALERQATCRVHRLTSRHPVKAYCLFSEATIEERKCAVLSAKHRLSANMIEALDGCMDDDEGQEEDPSKASSSSSSKAASKELRALITGDDTCLAVNEVEAPGQDEEDDDYVGQEEVVEAEESEEEEEEEESGREKKRPCNDGLYPVYEKLGKSDLKQPMVGKYGDPGERELWDWYTVQGRKEVHEKAPNASTAALRDDKPSRHGCQEERRKRALLRPFTLRPSRIGDVSERKDRVITVEFGDDTSCRLFIPEELWCHFQEVDSALKLRPAGDGEVPFPVFMPSSGRSAVDDAVGGLDLSGTMINLDGTPLKYLQIVAVRPSEVEKYRMSAPFFVVMELPRTATVQHPHYGRMAPEDLGVGCSRHWLVRLALALNASYVFMLDDSVTLWRGVTLVDDPHPQFGLEPGNKARFSALPMSSVLQHFAKPPFFAEELSKYVGIGFARACPELLSARRAYRRSHIYSALLLNVKRMETENLNFKQDIFIWEDFLFNLRAHDVVKCQRFAMQKQPFKSGGCSEQVARTEKPIIRAEVIARLSPEQIAAEALGEAPRETEGRGRGRMKKKAKLAEIAEVAERPVPTDPWQLEEDPALKPEGAVCDAKGNLLNSHYKRFIQAFKDAEKARADVAAPQGLKWPGVRKGETADGIKIWDDSKRPNHQLQGSGAELAEERWGAGYIAYPVGKDTKAGSKWFNVKTWGSWRMAFVLARLQYKVWLQKYEAEHPDSPRKSTGETSSTPKAKVIKSEPDEGSEKKKLKKGPGRPPASEGQVKQEKIEQKTTLDRFFVKTIVKQEPVEDIKPKQMSLKSFFKGTSSSSSSVAAIQQVARPVAPEVQDVSDVQSQASNLDLGSE
mmetsp:Transcript_10995/g.19584  ORF Transcript_10995/g.19584 Transcript_10995/m.19584 type:complete len:1541 (+) Transcript_10995:50-4672(+)|eukprot:CAMPEP_0197632912 /NCGR_PEP_ID=MMETSP1338-20131121/9432_1 /TAXON_ID=43686 ORGANISM="Pelagodinium beii, Strain RCC1491" /NCGR_SAMPLE_ID=MMETSP1338 /ASSEMBLY_ACC=CAM_ASM_000754 /LENGTH=1540 /DNA_ID=CAMNT_0043204489 /DNA_START=47 /DNA_END=4669 /DNA_ORIENTATION=-